MNQVRAYLLELFAPVMDSPKDALLPGGDFNAFWRTYFHEYVTTTVLRGFLGGMLGFGLAWLLSNTYFSEAAKQALPPQLWNVVVAFGLVCALACVLARLGQFHWLERHAFNSNGRHEAS